MSQRSAALLSFLPLPQRVHLNVLVNPHRPASPLKFFMKSDERGVQGLAVGSYIDRLVALRLSCQESRATEKHFVQEKALSSSTPYEASSSSSLVML